MEVQKFPPSPNWYLCDILCCGPGGNVVYGSRNTLVVAKFGDKLFEKLSFPMFDFIDYAHKERVTSVKFSPNKSGKFSNCFASAGDDSLVKLWDMNTLSSISVNFGHGESKKVISMDWSWGSTNMILSLDDSNVIVVWDIEKNTTVKLNIIKLLQMKKSSGLKANVGKLQPSIIKCCPHQPDLVAVGMKGGLVCLITLRDSGKILHCMRGHDKDVTSLSWCPVQDNVLGAKDDADQDKAFLLASVCKDRRIFIWRAIDGHFLLSVKLPTTFLGRHSRLPATGTYTTLDWCKKEFIICSSNYGEILMYNLSSGNKTLGNDSDMQTSSSNPSRNPWKLVHDIHPRGVYAIYCAKYSRTVADGEEKEMVVWSTAQDRQLVAVSLGDGKVLANIPTIGGFVYCMGSSPFDPTRIAVGLGDFSIRVWNTGNTKEVQMTTLWQKIKGKVMAIAWHPTQEMKLAFGTHEGRVGIQDITPGRLPVVFILRHHHAVYALSWGPPCYKEGENEKLPQFCLYSCGDGEILMYNPDEPDKEPKKMSSLMKGCEEVKKKDNICTDVSWKPDYSLLAVGNNDGTVQLYSPPHLKLVYTLYAHRKLLMTMAWHPLSTSSDTGLSPMRHWLATGSNDSVINVFDFSNLVKSEEGVECKNPVQSIAVLTGHQKKIVRISWSPHSSGQLCSASYDNTVRVWDVVHQTCTACFTGHLGASLTCLWNPLDPDVIISGSTDFTLCTWKISESKYVPKSANNHSKGKRAAAIAPQSDGKVKKSVTAPEESELADKQKSKAAKDVESSKSSGFGFKWKGSLFPISWKIAGGIGVIDGVQSLLERSEGRQSADGPVDAKLNFFGNREDMHDLLQKEEEHHKSLENVEYAQLMSLWRGNSAETIKDAIAKEKLNDWLVSMAPSVSHKVWMEACQAYSEQLAKAGKINHAATYLLACHKVDEAINLLRSRSLYREALAIARCRLAPDDPTAHNLTLEWGRNLLLKGNYEVSAMCFTSVGEYIEAARALARRSAHPECVAMAAKLALKAGDKGRELGIVFTMECIHMYLQSNNWDAALECIKQVPELKPLSLVVELHRRLEQGFRSNKDGDRSDLLSWWLMDKEDCESNASGILNMSPLPWNDDELSADDAYSCISTRRADKVAKNFILELAEELALSLCACGGELIERWSHILKAMSLCYSHQLLASSSEVTEKHCLLQFCILLTPKGPKCIGQLFGVPGLSTSAEGLVQSARAYCAFAAAAWAEEKWAPEGEQDWPWLSLASTLLSFLPDVLCPKAAVFFKAEVEMQKMEKELIMAKARSRAGGKVVVTEKLTVVENSESVAEGKISQNGTGMEGGEDVVASHQEENGGKALEEVISEKESELSTIRDMRQSFEKCRVSAPNPFICLFKLRNVCDMIVKCTSSDENCIPKDVMEFKEKVTAGIAS